MNKKTFFIIAGIIITIGGIVTTLFIKQANNVPYELATVQKGNIIQEVSASGKVESPTKIDLHFKNSGKLIAVSAKVGSKVSAGQVLAKQDTAQLDAQVSEMQAGIELQQAKLNQLLGGASNEDIRLTEIKLENAYQTLLNSTPQAYLDFTEQDYTNNYETPTITGTYTCNKEGNYKLKTYSSSGGISVEYSGLEGGSVFLTNTPRPIGNCGLFISLESGKIIYSGVEYIIEIPNKKALNYNSNYSAYKSASAELSLKKSLARSLDIDVYQAQIAQAEASLQKTQTQREDLIISAPSSGVVTEVNGDVGEIVGPEKTVVSLATGGALQVKLDVVEDNIVNVRVGQEARITFDSINGEEFPGKVVAIDPAGTIIGGAVYYKTTVLFEKKDERIRSGMTANVWIKTAVSENTLFVPVSAIQNKNGKKIIQIFDGKQTLDKEITTGIKNDLGMIEITSGVSVGEQVVLGNKK